MRKASNVLLICLCLILTGLLTFTVYATLSNVSLNMKNSIEFNADGIFYKVETTVYYAGGDDSVSIVNVADLNKSGEGADDGSNYVQFDAPKISQTNSKVFYKITITNYNYDAAINIVPSFSGEQLKALDGSVTTSLGSAVIKNKIESFDSNPVPVREGDANQNTCHKAVYLISVECLNFTKSFAFSNDFEFTITKV